MRQPSDTHYCLLLKRDIFGGREGGCVEIQEVRDDCMGVDFLLFALDVNQDGHRLRKMQMALRK